MNILYSVIILQLLHFHTYYHAIDSGAPYCVYMFFC